MADDRPFDSTEERVAQLGSDLEDLKSTLLARLARRPVGDVEPTIRTTPKAGTLLLQGQTVNRADYPDLWAWAQDAGLVTTGLFTNGDGTTTFVLPDFRGRVPVAANTGLPVGSKVGADSVTLSVAQMPSHGHSVSINAIGDHGHNFTTGGGGGHGGHFPGDQYMAAGGSLLGLAAWNSGGNWGGDHNHGGGVQLSGNHTHGVNQSNAGGGGAVDVRQASIAINWLIWV